MSVAVILPWPLWCALATVVVVACVLLRRAYLAELERTPLPVPEAEHTPAAWYRLPIGDEQ